MKLLQQLEKNLLDEGYSPRSRHQYRKWIVAFIRFHYLRHPSELSEWHIRLYLLHLSCYRKCGRYQIRQCTSALLFLYRRVLDLPDFYLPEPQPPEQPPHPAFDS
ncbi:MAG: phage integrase N-terminal SAM-like domain-containing protein [Balneolia bacterium]|nr:phage integrase N-terminal SAM-like domain-containing protein [Balneolia bacterium]